MRIAITCHPTQGGSGIVATELALALAQRGHEVHLVSHARPFRLAADAPVHFHLVTVTDYPLFKYPPHDLSLVNKLVEVVLEHQIDVIHAHYAVPHAICAILARHVLEPHPVRVVATLHGTDITLVGSHPDFFELCRFAMLRCDGVTAVSQWLADRTVEKFDLPASPDVVYNFIDSARFQDGNRTPHPGDGEFEICHVSNFRPVKRTADVVRVFHGIQAALPARLTLAGDGPDLGIARELCAELDICHKVRFEGARTNIESIYRRSHLFLLLSDYESFGLAALEAMACGTPVAVSRAGGLPEVVTDSETGLLCPVGGIQEITDRSLQLLRDRSAWEEMSRRTARAARKSFTADRAVAGYETLYQTLLDERESHAL